MNIKTAFTEKILDMIPGILVWTTILGGIMLSFLKPLLAIYLIMAFDIYWLLKIIYLLFYMISSWRKYLRDTSIDWMKILQTENLHWENYYHLIFLPVFKEPYEIIENTFEHIVSSTYPKEKFIIVLTGEERGGKEDFLSKAEQIKNKYEKYFKILFINVHPKNLKDELAGKGSNLHHAGVEIKKIIDAWELNYDTIIVSSFDIDTCPHKQYFSYLTYTYLKNKNPTRKSYQPIAVYNNNLWQSNPIIRVVASSTTFWLFTDLARAEKLFTFSSHSMSFRALVDVGFWDKTIVSEDSRIFLQCFLKYDGQYFVEPLYMPVYMNTVDIGNFIKSIKNQYKQMRRWAWGIEHFPWMVKNFFAKGRNANIPKIKRVKMIFYHLEGMYSWATAPLITYVIGRLPLWIAPEREIKTTLFQNAPAILSYLMSFSMIGLFAIAVMYFFMLPPLPNNYKKIHYIIILFQWLLIPLTIIIFGSVPAADAQTRLMLGGKFRLGFWVTEKKKL